MSPRTVAELQELVATGTRVKYLHFWGHRPEPDGSVGSGALSQWWPSPFTVDGRTFATAEHFMMWSKATLFGDVVAAAEVLTAPHPHRAKAIGRGVKGFDQTVWKQHRVDIVTTASLAKFGQHPQLLTYLIATGARVLVEASPMDQIWGIGLAADDVRAADPYQWRGLNLLGFALMAAREALGHAETDQKGV